MWPGPAVLVRYGGTQANVPPSITTPPLDQDGDHRPDGDIHCRCDRDGTPLYQWQKNNVNISGATSAGYTTPAAVAGDNGATFRCIVTNNYGNATSTSATLTVTSGSVPPTITQHPLSQTKTVGQPVTFAVVATGTAPLSYQWQRNTVNISGSEGSSLHDSGRDAEPTTARHFGASCPTPTATRRATAPRSP